MPTKRNAPLKQEPGKAPQFDIKRNDDNPRRPSAKAFKVYRLSEIKGYKQREIAERLGMSRPFVAELITKVHRYLRSKNGIKAPIDIQVERNRHREMLMHVATEALRAWERSKRPAKKIKRKGVEGDPEYEDAIIGEVEQSTESQCGDPAYLRTAMDALREIRRMDGIDAPPQRNPDEAGSGANAPIDGGVVVFIPHNNREPLPGLPPPDCYEKPT